jgi:hypothetical protein
MIFLIIYLSNLMIILNFYPDFIDLSNSANNFKGTIQSFNPSTNVASVKIQNTYGNPNPYFIGDILVQRTSAGSRNWNSIASSFDGSKLVATVNAGYIYTSTNTGVSWVERTSTGLQNWSGIASSTNGNVLAATVNPGYIYTSTNSGVNWTQRTSSSYQNWSHIASSYDGSMLAATVNGGNIWTTADSGVTWTQRTSSSLQKWSSIASSSDGSKLVAGHNSLLNIGDSAIFDTIVLRRMFIPPAGGIINARELQCWVNNINIS